MPNTSRRWKLDYKNSSGSREIIAEKNQDTGALKIDRHVHIRRKNDPDILKIWLDGTDFSAIPTKKSEFGLASNGRDEQEILLKHYNEDTSSFDTVNRFYPKNKGTVDENGNLAWKLFSHMKSTAQETVPAVNNSNDIESALNDVLPSDYDATVPAGASVPNVDNYKLSNNGETDREKGYHELTRNYNYAMTFTSSINGSGNAEVKFEPEGFGGTVDTLVPNEQATTHSIVDVDTGSDTFFVSGDITDTFALDQSIEVVRSTANDDTYTIDTLNYDSGENETDIAVKENISNSTADGQIIPGGQAVFKSWEKEKADEVINKVRVEGTDSNGNTITGTAKNQTQINNYGERFKKVKVGYVQSSSEADDIAENYLKPGKDDSGNDIAEVPESGIVRTTVYTDNVVNDSFQIVDNTRDIDDTFTVVEQRNHWPEAVSIIEFEFEKENLERAAVEKENLRDERARLYPDESKSLSGQTGEDDPDVDGDSDDTGPDVNGDTGDSDPDVGGDTGDTGPNVSGVSSEEDIVSKDSDSESRSGVSVSGSSWTQASVLNTSGNTTLYHAYRIKITEISASANWFKIAVSDDSEGFGQVIFMDTISSPDARTFTEGTTNVEVVYEKVFILPAGAASQISSHYLSLTASTGVDVDFTFEVSELSHEHQSGTYDADLHPHDDGTLDTDLHPHDDGTLDAVLHPHGDGTYGVVLHPHDAGSLEAETTQEDKTDR